ncbi:MAG: PilZ domain-containing protein [Kiloniellaceae bacterium]
MTRSTTQNRREWPRYTAEKTFALTAGVDGRLLPCTVADVSLGGAKLLFDEEIAPDATLRLTNPEGQAVSCERVWQDGRAVGIEFDFSEDALSLISHCIRNTIAMERQAANAGA